MCPITWILILGKSCDVFVDFLGDLANKKRVRISENKKGVSMFVTLHGKTKKLTSNALGADVKKAFQRIGK